MKTALEILEDIRQLKDDFSPEQLQAISIDILRLKGPTSLPPGKYWVGDLCYVMASKWDEVCKLTLDGQDVLDGLFQLTDGTKFGFLCTAWGDGIYRDQHGNKYSVDAGLIGCILVSDIAEEDKELFDSGTVFDFDEPFTVRAEHHEGRRFGMKSHRPGILKICTVVIDTDPEEDYDDEEDEIY